MHAVTYEHGVHLSGSPLWFDAQRRRELCILMGLEQEVPPQHRRLLTSPAMALALDQMGYIGSVLPSPWGRWIGVGGHRVQLIDARAAPGGVAAWVGDDHAPLLVTGMLRVHGAEWPRAEHVVARLPALRHGGAPLAQVATAVAGSVEGQGGRSSIWVDSLEVGLALHRELLRLGLITQPKGVLSTLLAPAPSTVRATLAVARPSMPFEAGAIRVSSGLLPWQEPPTRGLAPPLKVRWYADLAALQSVLTASRARRVSLIDVPPAVESAVCTGLGTQVRVRFLGSPTCGISQRS